MIRSWKCLIEYECAPAQHGYPYMYIHKGGTRGSPQPHPHMITKQEAEMIWVYYQSSLHNRIRQMPPRPSSPPCSSPMCLLPAWANAGWPTSHGKSTTDGQAQGLTLQTQWLRISVCFLPSLSLIFISSCTLAGPRDSWPWVGGVLKSSSLICHPAWFEKAIITEGLSLYLRETTSHGVGKWNWNSVM